MDHKPDVSEPPQVGDRTAAEAVTGDQELRGSVIKAFAATNPIHRARRSASAAPDIEWIVDLNLRLIGQTLATGERAASERDLDTLAASAARRADEGATLESIIAAYVRGFGEVWRRIAQRAGPADIGGLTAATDLLFAHLDTVLGVVATGYANERARMSVHEQDARFALFQAMISGSDVEAAARRAGIGLAATYLVLSIAGDALADEDASEAVSARRRIHRLERVIDGIGADHTLAVLGEAGGTALVPWNGATDPIDLSWLGEELSGAWGGPVVAGAEFAPVRQVHEALAVAEDLVRIAHRTRRGPGLYRLSDLMLEYQLSRPSLAHNRLAATLDPLSEHSELLATLGAFVESGFDRRATAAARHVHPNTIDYRVGRISTLCGVDLATVHGRQLVAAALAVRALTDPGS
ncbi:helix-turn-helix domain-containing protein (plasmid) [Prescottella equi]|uniref:PucR family transcriptional regulator n=1 Tax=Rhodococcus hoagii TaxID=43767 RepID=UPI002575320E|nr:helix-turn-helix domain-containing protein [Prescottella equi]WJJ14343.1 helix-turn-helix domain-containing protein [Prescottella equi]